MDGTAGTGFVPGGWDMFHIGHLNLLRRARERCRHLVVGVATDELLIAVKGRPPVIPHHERMEIVSALGLVDEVVADGAEDKRVMWRRIGFDQLYKGDDWRGTPKGERLESTLAEVGVTVTYLPYTGHISSTLLRVRRVS